MVNVPPLSSPPSFTPHHLLPPSLHSPLLMVDPSSPPMPPSPTASMTTMLTLVVHAPLTLLPAVLFWQLSHINSLLARYTSFPPPSPLQLGLLLSPLVKCLQPSVPHPPPPPLAQTAYVTPFGISTTTALPLSLPPFSPQLAPLVYHPLTSTLVPSPPSSNLMPPMPPSLQLTVLSPFSTAPTAFSPKF